MAGTSIATGLYSSGNSDLSGPNQPSVSQDNKSFSLQLTPSLGWFISENTVLGASALVSVSNQKATNSSGGVTYKEDKLNNVDFGLGGFARYYFNTTASLRPFAHFQLTAGSGSTTSDGFYYYTAGTATVKQTYEGRSKGRFFYNAGLNAGFTKMVGANAGLDLFAGYLYSFNKRTTKTTAITDHTDPSMDLRSEYETDVEFTGHGFTFGIGFQVFLRKK
jgi:hypothetical protein